jgi:hypothetical protein
LRQLLHRVPGDRSEREAQAEKARDAGLSAFGVLREITGAFQDRKTALAQGQAGANFPFVTP